ncbi:hypothetical protein TM49_21455 [Martelella endophytica]|uniref:Uncharacterized protein n=1 Tax=Martelella endophytica TaxID=1486262 RepID=A0A0D5LUJ5_MAREN|nr:hypothetical protein TM49_21455 [Martelella endophytica]
MSSKSFEPDSSRSLTEDEITYIRQILGQLRRLSDREGTEMLCYLIDMAYMEAGESQARLAEGRVDS